MLKVDHSKYANPPQGTTEYTKMKSNGNSDIYFRKTTRNGKYRRIRLLGERILGESDFILSLSETPHSVFKKTIFR